MDSLLQKTIAIAQDAGKILMKYYPKDVAIELKSSAYDWVTKADRESDAFVRRRIGEEFPGAVMLSEENEHMPPDYRGSVWMIDPLDATKDFVNKGTGFSVMIGLCENGVPVLGVTYAPATGVLYYASKGCGAYKGGEGAPEKLSATKVMRLEDARMVTRIPYGEPRSLEHALDALPVKERVPEGSVGLKIGLIAEGKAEFHIATNPRSSKWDTCAPQIILEEAGGVLTDAKGDPLDYTQEGLNWRDLFVASASPALHNQVIGSLQRTMGSQSFKPA